MKLDIIIVILVDEFDVDIIEVVEKLLGIY